MFRQIGNFLGRPDLSNLGFLPFLNLGRCSSRAFLAFPDQSRAFCMSACGSKQGAVHPPKHYSGAEIIKPFCHLLGNFTPSVQFLR